MSLTPASEALRATRVGASEVAALLSCGHPYTTPGDIYARIVHGVRRPQKAHMAVGEELEGLVIRGGARRLDIRVRRNSRTWVHASLPLAATPDATVPGHPALLEAKTVSHWEAEEWADGVPPHVQAQAQAQMLVTGRLWCHVVALLGGSRWLTATLAADEEQQLDIAYAVARFEVNHLQRRIPPPDLDDELVLTIAAPEGTVAAQGDLADYGDRLAALAAARDAAEKAYQEARGALGLAMAAAGAALVVAADWRAETITAPATGLTSIRFDRRKRAAA